MRILKRAAVCLLFCALPFFSYVHRQTETTHLHKAVDVFDPDWVYLGGALLLAEGKDPVNVYHPGIPLQWAGSLLMDDARSVLSHPEIYLGKLSRAYFLFCMALLALLPLLLLRAGSPIALALLAQAIFLSFTETLAQFPHPKPDLFVGIWALAVAGLAALEQKEKKLRPTWMGITLGLGLAMKFNFAPLLVFIFAFDTWPRRLEAAALCAASFFFFTLPMWGHYDEMFAYYRSLGRATGNYSFPAPRLLTFLFAAGTISTFFSQRKKLPALALLAILGTVALACKHADMTVAPARYLLPAFALAGALPFLLQLTGRGCWILASVVMLFLGIELTEKPLPRLEFGALKKAERLEFFAEALFTKYKNCHWLYDSFPATRLDGMEYLNHWTSGAYLSLMRELYPVERAYWGVPGGLRSFSRVNKHLDDVKQELKNGACYLLLAYDGGNKTLPDRDLKLKLRYTDITAENRELLQTGDLQDTRCHTCRVLKVNGVQESTAP